MINPEKTKQICTDSIASLFTIEQDIRQVTNHMFDTADIDLTRHAIDLADALAVIARTRSEMIEESNKQTKQ